MYPFEEQVDMILIYGECQRNSVQARILYSERYPDRILPSRQTFTNVCNKLRQTGCLSTRKSDCKKKVTHEGNEVGVLAMVARNPHVSSRQIERESGVSKRSVLRILHRHKFHPYHLSLHQELHGTDFVNRVRFCEWAQQQIRNNESFVDNILFTDEANFTNHGNVNLRNMHMWAVENPHWLRQVDHQRQWSLNVWCGIIGNKIIGPYFIDGHLNGNMYANFLENTLGPLLEDLPLITRHTMWYQHDGCPAHFSLVARNKLNEKFPNRWIGRGGRVMWPARSPDLTPLDYFLWGTLKDMVYKEEPTTLHDMQQRIIAACASISPDVIKRSTQSVIGRIQSCIDNNGHHFEHLL